MPEKLLNDFLLGADPEMILLDPPELVNGMSIRQSAGRPYYGWDHGGYVVEPHPTPHRSARAVCRNIKSSLDVLAHDFPEYRFRAGAYYKNGRQRSVTLGGHVHLDISKISRVQLAAMDNFAQSLVRMDVLPAAECGLRCSEQSGYGRCGDVRSEHGHVEYRTLCSWLFSRKTSMLCMTGIKLAAVAPETVKVMDSITELSNWYELFKGKDDDVDWILDRKYFDKSIEARPDANVKAVWQVDEGIGAKLATVQFPISEARGQTVRVNLPLRFSVTDALSQSNMANPNAWLNQQIANTNPDHEGLANLLANARQNNSQ